jgi:hypothetical protein
VADYDNFARTIAEKPIDYIVQSQDMISRDAGGDAELDEWWSNVDGRNTSMTDFMTEYPAMQARSYGTAWIVMDRPSQIYRESDDANPANRPYIYCIPSRNVAYWKISSYGELEGVVILEPRNADDACDYKVCPIRVWTNTGWGVFVPDALAKTYVPIAFGENEAGRVPIVRLFDESPPPLKAMGTSVMLGVSRVARTCYNIDSEIRELERKCAFAFLALPTKDASQFDEAKIKIGTSTFLPFDSEGGEPKWISPDLDSIVKLMEHKKEKKQDAFGMAHMAAVSGYIQTSSGFHAEAEFDKTNRRIGKFAKSLELAEVRLSQLFAAYMDRESKATITYPRDFGIKDLDKVYERTQKRLNMNAGKEDAIATMFDFYSVVYPRRDRASLLKMAEQAASERELAKEAERAREAVRAEDNQKRFS